MKIIDRVCKNPLAKAILFGGDRLSCCNAFVHIEDKGIATIAMQGEQGSGVPTIVGVYVAPNHRKQGVGRKLLSLALARIEELGGEKARIDCLTSNMLSVAQSLSKEKKLPIPFIVKDMCSGVNELVLY